MTKLTVGGVEIHRGFLDREAQITLRDRVVSLLTQAPLIQPVTPRGQKMSVRMSAAGAFGWVTDRRGYRYEPRHPSGHPWPAIPAEVLSIWNAVSGCARAPECCLINHYTDTARMGLHQDRDEADFSCPVVSISLGDDALFRVGGTARRDRTQSVWLSSGDVAVLGGPARLAYHGIDRIRPGSSTLLPDGGRLNLTLRVVSAA